MKTPISYYGGKQSMLKNILPLIPEHRVYCELFFGGGAVFWAKEPAQVEVINDNNGMVVNFFEQLKTNFENVKKMIDATPFGRQVYAKAMVVYQNPYIFEPAVKAWAFWVCTIQGFGNKIGSWRSSQTTSREATLIDNKRQLLTREYAERLRFVQIEQCDAVKLIEKLDTLDTFFYAEPPYVNSLQGHYGGYTQEHFNVLLNALSNIKGKFLLSSYPNVELDHYRKKNNWQNNDVKMNIGVSRTKRQKIECLTYNY